MSTTEQGRANTARQARADFPLWLSCTLLLFATLALPGALLAYLTGALNLPFIPAPLSENFLAGKTLIGSVLVPNVQILALVVMFISLVFGLIFTDIVIIAPARRLLHFLAQLRAQEFKSVPVLHRLGSGEIGAIGRQMGFATLEFARMRAEADSSIEQRSLFLTTAAHQLRTPLSELLWSIEDLRSEKTPLEEKQQLLASVDGTLRRMRLIIEHLLSGAGVEEGRFGYVFESIDVSALIAGLVEEFKPLSERRHVPVVFQQEEAFPVFADKERISLVLFDLISNAINYTPDGGSVVVAAKSAGERLEISVADTGIGIAESERALLFNKFYRSERARHMRPDGSGLGLFLAKTIVERHGSDLAIDSQEGKGTKVTFYLHSKRENVPR